MGRGFHSRDSWVVVFRSVTGKDYIIHTGMTQKEAEAKATEENSFQETEKFVARPLVLKRNGEDNKWL